MSHFGLTPEQLAQRHKSSLIRYIGALQVELQLLYNTQFQSHRAAIVAGVDQDAEVSLNANHGRSG